MSKFQLKDNIYIAKERLKENAQVMCKTDLNFLKIHNGLRPGNIHLVMGLSGGGKSTFMRTMINDTWKNKKPHQRLSVWFSEESENDFSTMIARTEIGENVFKTKALDFFSEVDHELSIKEMAQSLKELAKKSAVLFFDNLTTSSFYAGDFNQQNKFIILLKKIAVELNIPVVIFAHTDAKVKEGAKGLIEQNDIRGPKSIVNHAQFIYILQQFHIGNEIFTTLRLVKHRGQSPDHKMFSLIYDPVTMTYNKSRQIMFSEFKAIFGERNKL